VIGKARVIVLPFDRAGLIESTNPQSTAVGMGGSDAGAPLALGLLGALPLVAARQRRRLRDREVPDFLERAP
jgi:signal peptidase I